MSAAAPTAADWAALLAKTSHRPFKRSDGDEEAARLMTITPPSSTGRRLPPQIPPQQPTDRHQNNDNQNNENSSNGNNDSPVTRLHLHEAISSLRNELSHLQSQIRTEVADLKAEILQSSALHRSQQPCPYHDDNNDDDVTAKVSTLETRFDDTRKEMETMYVKLSDWEASLTAAAKRQNEGLERLGRVTIGRGEGVIDGEGQPENGRKAGSLLERWEELEKRVEALEGTHSEEMGV